MIRCRCAVAVVTIVKVVAVVEFLTLFIAVEVVQFLNAILIVIGIASENVEAIWVGLFIVVGMDASACSFYIYAEVVQLTVDVEVFRVINYKF